MKYFLTKSRGHSAVDIVQLRSFRWFVPYLAIILLFLFFPPAAHAQQKIAGKVTSATETLIGATIEGLGYFDLKRWQIAAEVLNNVKDGLLPYKIKLSTILYYLDNN
ncbi:hypothetical protein [Pedobacter sp. JCM 36344]|uniref:hypothetical protein n=1 Tax=Pedobacter sp. JCM 36344 TaxID=3374280 RepID=UPI003978249F